MNDLSSKLAFVCGSLANDEASSDEELAQHFVAEIGIEEERARQLVALRQDYLVCTDLGGPGEQRIKDAALNILRG